MDDVWKRERGDEQGKGERPGDRCPSARRPGRTRAREARERLRVLAELEVLLHHNTFVDCVFPSS